MIHNIISSLKTLYPLVQGGRHALTEEKLSLWLKSQLPALDAEVKDRHAFPVKEVKAILANTQRESADAPSQEKLIYYKMALNFISNQLFPFTFRTFYSAILAAPSLDKERLNNILKSNNCEADDALITDYLTNWSSKQYPDHLKFFNRLNQKIDNEDAKTSNEMIALLFVRVLLERYHFFSSEERLSPQKLDYFIANDSSTLTLHDFVFLLARHLISAKENEIEAEASSLLNKLIPALERAITLENGSEDMQTLLNTVVDTKTKIAAYVELSGLFANLINHSASNAFLMRFVSSRRDLLNYLDPNICIKTKNGENQPLSLSILTLIKNDSLILKNLLKANFFNKIKLDQAFIKKNKLNIKNIETALYNATMADIDIWNQLDPTLFELINKDSANKLYHHHPKLIGIILVRKILTLDTVSDQHTQTTLTQTIAGRDPLKSAAREAVDTIARDSDAFILELLSHAKKEPLILDFILNHDEFISFLGNCLTANFAINLSSINKASQHKQALTRLITTINHGKTLAKNVIAQIDALHPTGKVWDKIWSSSFFMQIKSMDEQNRKAFLSCSKIIVEKYAIELASQHKEEAQSRPASAPLLQKEIPCKIKKEQPAQPKQPSEKKVAAQVKPLPTVARIKSPPQTPPIAAASTTEKTTLVLSLEQRKTFTDGICAVVAGNAIVDFKWEEPNQNDPGHFMVNFSQLGNEFKIFKPNKQDDDTWITLTDEKRDVFFNTFVPSKLETHLGNNIAITSTPHGLRIVPKTERCAYPEDLHNAALNYLTKHGTVSKKQKAPASPQQLPFTPLTRQKKTDPYRLLLSQPTESRTCTDTPTISAPQDALPPLAPVKPLDSIKKMWSGMIQDVLPNQFFHFLMIEEEKNRFLIKINTKGAPCLSNQETQFDTYIVMKSIVAALQEKYGEKFITFSPADELDPQKYTHIKCRIAIKTSKAKLNEIAINASNDANLKKSFATFLEIYSSIANCYKAYKDCELEMQGRANQTVATLNEPLETPAPLCKPYQHLTVKNEQAACLYALFEELKSLTPLLEKYKNNASRLLATESRQIVCYHRIFHNLAWVFHDNGHQTISLFARTLRDTYRHGYFKIPPELGVFIEQFTLVLMAYEKGAKLPSSHLYSRAGTEHHISFPVTQSMHHELSAKLKTLLQEKWNHLIGLDFKEKRMALADKLKNAIEEISAATDIGELEKQSMIVAMTSRVGESDKTSKVYAGTYGRLGTHDHHLTMLPKQLTEEVYQEFICGKKMQYSSAYL